MRAAFPTYRGLSAESSSACANRLMAAVDAGSNRRWFHSARFVVNSLASHHFSGSAEASQNLDD